MAPRGLSARRHPLVAAVLRLRRPAERRGQGVCVAEGPHLLAEGLRAGLAPLALIATSAAMAAHADVLAPLRQALAAIPQAADPPRGLWLVADGVLDAMAETVTPQGLLAVFSLARAAADGPPTLVLALDGVQDPGNVGALARALWAFGGATPALWLGPGTADAYGGKAIRASAGAAFHLAVTPCPDLPAALAAWTLAGGDAWALVPRGGVPLPAARLGRRLALVVGGEGPGVSEAVRRVCRPLSIPMGAGSESLNAAQAGTIALYAQRTQGPGRSREPT